MGCPVHIWVPAMAAVAPAATMARHKLRSLIPSKKHHENPADRLETMQHWSPLTSASTASATASAPSTDQAAK